MRRRTILFNCSQALYRLATIHANLNHSSSRQACTAKQPSAPKHVPGVSHGRNGYGTVPRYELFLPCGGYCFPKGNLNPRPSKPVDRSCGNVRTVLIRSRFRAPERRTINSNLKMTTTRNTWSRRQRSWNGLAHETYCRPDVPRERGHCALRSPFIFVILAQISEHPPEVGVSDVYHYHHRHQHSSRDPRRRRGIAQHGFSFRVSAVVQPGGGG